MTKPEQDNEQIFPQLDLEPIKERHDRRGADYDDVCALIAEVEKQRAIIDSMNKRKKLDERQRIIEGDY